MQCILSWKMWRCVHIKQAPLDWFMHVNRRPLIIFFVVIALDMAIQAISLGTDARSRDIAYILLPAIGIGLAAALSIARCSLPPAIEMAIVGFTLLTLTFLHFATVVASDELEYRLRNHETTTTFWKFVPAVFVMPIIPAIALTGLTFAMDVGAFLVCYFRHGDPFQLRMVWASAAQTLGSLLIAFMQVVRLCAIYDAQQALTMEKALLETLITMMSDAVCWLSEDGVTLLRVDQRFAALAGRPAAGKHFAEFLAEEERERIDDSLERAKTAPVQLPTTLVSDAGARIPVNLFIVGPRHASLAVGQREHAPGFLAGLQLASTQGIEGFGTVSMSPAHEAMLAQHQTDLRAVGPREEDIPSTSAPETTSTGRILSDVDVNRWLQGTPENEASELKIRLEAVEALGQKEHWLVNQQDLELEPDELLGAGAFGFVVGGWLHGSPIAVKVARRRRDASVEHLVAILNEVRCFRHIRHPNVTLCYGAYVEPLQCEVLLILERVKGLDLSRYVAQHGTDAEIYGRLQLLLDVACALRYLHGQSPQIVHGDLKGSNVLVEAAVPRAKLLDFGLSRLLTRRAKPLGGSVHWMAPELLIRPTTSPSTSADVFSFGRLAYLILACRKPLEGLRPAAVKELARAGHVHGLDWDEDRPLQRQGAALCRRALSLAPEGRPSIREIHEEASAWELPDLEERMPAAELARAAPRAASARPAGGGAAALAGALHALREALAAATRQEAQPDQAAAEAGAPQGPPAALEASAPPLAVPGWQQTVDSAKAFLLLDTLRQWNYTVPPGTCCKYHAAIAELRRMARLLTTTACKPDYEPYGAFQCQRCGILDFDVHSGCPNCETFPDGPPSLASILEEVPEAEHVSGGAPPRCSL